jgi:uncharacterized protein YegL
MEKKHQVHNLIILDESGSMESIKSTIIEGFNEIVQTVKGIEQSYPDQEHFISFVTFNGLGINTMHFNEPVKKLGTINQKLYKPNASTPLFDAMGLSLVKLRNALQHQSDYNVLVTILTDGEENSSKEFSGEMIKKMVQDLSAKNWTFTYIGTDHNVEKFADSIAIINTMNFAKNDIGIQNLLIKEKAARSQYSERIRQKINTEKNFYQEEEEAPVLKTMPIQVIPKTEKSWFQKIMGN